MAFNPNELILEKIRSVEEYDPATLELTGRYTQIEEPSLKTSANATDVTDAMGAPIQTFYTAQTGTFDFTNSYTALSSIPVLTYTLGILLSGIALSTSSLNTVLSLPPEKDITKLFSSY